MWRSWEDRPPFSSGTAKRLLYHERAVRAYRSVVAKKHQPAI